MIAFCNSKKAKEISKVMAGVWKKETVPVKQFILDFDGDGVKII